MDRQVARYQRDDQEFGRTRPPESGPTCAESQRRRGRRVQCVRRLAVPLPLPVPPLWCRSRRVLRSSPHPERLRSGSAFPPAPTTSLTERPAMGSRSLAAAPSGKTIWSTISGLRSAGGGRYLAAIPLQAAKPRRSLLFLGGKMAR